jgi:hypothetical protein
MTAIAVVIAGFCAVWLVEAALVFRHLGQIEDLARLEPEPPPVWPRVSIVMPARNEATDIAASLQSRLADGYPDLEIVVVDDRSDDDTPRLVAEAAARDPRVRTLRVDELPDGWLGKVHALDLGVRAATGDWLLFTDADVMVTPGTLARAVAHCEGRGLDLLALAPEFRSRSGSVNVLWTIFVRLVSTVLSPAAVRDPGSSVVIGSGGFTLLRRVAFERTPGFEHLRLETADDVGLAVMIKRAGGRCDFVNGRRAARVSIYDDLSGFFRGVEKHGAALAGTPFVVIAAAVLLFGCVEYAPLAAVAVGLSSGVAWLAVVGVATTLLATAATVAALRRNTGMVWPALLWPAGWLLVAVGMLRSAWLVHARGGVAWRGTFHSREELLEARRMRRG